MTTTFVLKTKTSNMELVLHQRDDLIMVWDLTYFLSTKICVQSD